MSAVLSGPHDVGGDDLLEMLGVKLPEPTKKEVSCGQKPPKMAPQRHTEWNNATSFKFGGYVAVVTQTTCEMCGKVNEHLDGIFTEEIHQPSGTRRLQALAKGAQWPANEEHRLEVAYKFTPVCAHCIKDLGFSREVDKPKTYTLVVGE
jgi:hypothetical protein